MLIDTKKGFDMARRWWKYGKRSTCWIIKVSSSHTNKTKKRQLPNLRRSKKYTRRWDNKEN